MGHAIFRDHAEGLMSSASPSSMENLDCHLVRVPFEALKRAAKDRKSIVDTIAEAAAVLPVDK